MSWLSKDPPWATIQWFQWGDPHKVLFSQGPDIKVSKTVETNEDQRLFKLKQDIELLDLSGQWEFLKRSSNPFELVFSQSQDIRIPQSVSNLRPLSRSFFKMTEILSVLDFFKRHKKNIQSAHVCEGPGGFIESLLYQSYKNQVKLEHAWAMTLRPTRSNIPGWKRAQHFLNKSPMVHIEYGADDTGDIMVPENQTAFLEKNRSRCSIFTADGGFDFSEHYGHQEAGPPPPGAAHLARDLPPAGGAGHLARRLTPQQCLCSLSDGHARPPRRACQRHAGAAGPGGGATCCAAGARRRRWRRRWRRRRHSAAAGAG